jgi:iron complex outermembrane recepter protein
MFSKKFLTGVALSALSMGIGGVAHAQSTASQLEEEEIIVTGTRNDIGGAITNEQAPRARTTITDDLIDQQAAGQTILNIINLVPGVTFSNNDAYGSSGGNITMRGFDGNRVSLTFDGIPLNDTGNYAIYSNQQLDPELISRANVNMGTTESDSPTASATGGTINYVTYVPSTDPGLLVQPSIGSDNYYRLFARVDTGEFTPIGTRFYLAGSYQSYDQFIGPGELEKQQVNARLYQPIGNNGDFVSISGHYNVNRNHFYRNFNLATFNSGNWPVNTSTCTRLTPGPGTQNENGLCNNYYNVRINPSNTGNIRMQSRFSLGDALTLTVDPNFQFVRANGGGIEAVFENDIRLRGASASPGVDLNGDGDVVDRIQLYSPSNTNTYRYGVLSSLIWDINDDHRVRFGYTWDEGQHQQTGEYSRLDAQGNPDDVFGGRRGFGTPIMTAEGLIFQKRDRNSVASLSQLSMEYRGDFLNDAMTVILGVRAPEFTRELDQDCYSAKGSTSSTQFCTTASHTPSPTSPGFVRFAGSTTDYAPTFEAEVSYDDILPNVGVTYRFLDNHQIYASYAEGLSAPRTDDLYGGILVSQLSTVVPETTQTYDFGYRYQTPDIILATGVWFTAFENRIVRSSDPLDPTVSYARNVGAVDLWGFDLQAGWEITEAFSLYGSVAYSMSELQSNLPGQTQGRGNQLVDSPEWTLGTRAEYDFGPVQFGLQAKWTGDRYSNDFNTEVAPSFTTVDLDLRWDLGDSWNNERTYFQLNVINALDEEYISTISSGANGGMGFFGPGAPRTFMLTLRTEF